MAVPFALPDVAGLPRLVAIDLDGTLLDPAGVLRPRSRAAVELVLDAGVPVVIATARPLRRARLALDGGLLERVTLAHMNGVAIAVNGEASAAWAQLAGDVALRAAGLIESLAPAARAVVEVDGHVFGCSQELAPALLWETNSATPEMVVSLHDAIERGPVKIAVNGLGCPLHGLASRLREELGEAADILLDGTGDFLNVLPRGVSKQAALLRIHGQDADPWRGMLAFGDDTSDIEVLRQAEYGVAMANAVPDVLHAARYRTHSNAEDGVAHVLERIVRPRI